MTDPQGESATYEYDPVGNILAVRRENVGGPVAITGVTPNTGPAGTLVEISGIGFSDNAAEDQVTVGGVPAEVVRAGPCSLIVRIPGGVTSGSVTITTPLGSAIGAEPFGSSDLVISATASAMVVGTSLQFTATFTGCADQRVIWSVNGSVGGSTTLGTITQTGLYTAPAIVPAPPTVTILAESVGCPGLFSETTIMIVSAPNYFAGAAVSVGRPVLPDTARAAPVSVNVPSP